MIARLFLSHEFIEFIEFIEFFELPQGGKPAIGDGVWWTTCKRKAKPEAQLGDRRNQSDEPRRVGCGENPQVGTCHPLIHTILSGEP